MLISFIGTIIRYIASESKIFLCVDRLLWDYYFHFQISWLHSKFTDDEMKILQ